MYNSFPTYSSSTEMKAVCTVARVVELRCSLEGEGGDGKGNNCRVCQRVRKQSSSLFVWEWYQAGSFAEAP